MGFCILVIIYLENPIGIDIFCSIFVVVSTSHIPGTRIKRQHGLMPVLLLLSKKIECYRARLKVIPSSLSTYISLMFPFTQWLNILSYGNKRIYII